MNVHDHRALGSEPLSPEQSSKDGLEPVHANAPGGARRSSLFMRILRGFAKTILPLLVIAAGYAGYQYFVATKPEPPRKAQAERAFSVRTQVVAVGTVQPILELYGTTVAGREVDMRALVGGRIIETSPDLREGGKIEAGTTLLTIDPLDYDTEVRQTQAQLAEAKSRIEELKASRVAAEASLDYTRQQLVIAERDVERAEPLVRRGATSEKTMDDRKQVVLQRKQATEQLSNEMAVWAARIAQQEAVAERLEATLARAKQRLADTRLKTPYDAYVTDVSAQVGRMVGVNDKVATLIDRDWVDVRFTLTDEQFGRIVSSAGDLVGRAVEVDWHLGATTFTYTAKVERVGARVTAASGGVEVFARVADPLKPQPLRPGAFVTVRIPDATFADVVQLPATALYDGNKVFVIEDNRLKARTIEVVGAEGNTLLLRGDIKTGELVLTSRISTPGDGVLVTQVEAQ